MSSTIQAVSRVIPGIDLPGANLTNSRITELMHEVRDTRRQRNVPGDLPISTPDFPEQRLGIRTRTVLDANLTSRDLAVAAGRAVMDKSGIDRERVVIALVSTVTADKVVPAIATTVQHELGLPSSVVAFDLSLGCNGFTAAYDCATRMLKSFPVGSCALVIAAEAMSRVVDVADRATCPIFGDGAGAVVISKDDTSPSFPVETITMGSMGELIQIAPGPVDGPPPFRFSARDGAVEIIEDRSDDRRVIMRGNQVFRDMVRLVPKAIRYYLDHHSTPPTDIDKFVFHQANRRMIEAIARNDQLAIPAEKLLFHIDYLGNTTSASIPILLSEADESGELRTGDRVAMIGFGTGYSLSIAMVDWR